MILRVSEFKHSIVKTIVPVALLVVPSLVWGQNSTLSAPVGWEKKVPSISSHVTFAQTESDMRGAVYRYVQDMQSLERRYPVNYSTVRYERILAFHQGWQEELQNVDFESLNDEGQIDFIILKNRITYNIERLNIAQSRGAEIIPVLPFAAELGSFQERRFDRVRVVPRDAANTIDKVTDQILELTDALIEDAEVSEGVVERDDVTPVIAARAVRHIDHLKEILDDWNTFYDGYDPEFSWWIRKPYAKLVTSLDEYSAAINEHLVGIKPDTKAPIVSNPVFADGLAAELAVEMIPYSAEELIEIGEKEFEWIVNEFKIVSNRMGYGDDWQAALEHTKQLAPPPGEKPWAIFDIGAFSEDFITKWDNITIPPLPQEIWRLEMQTAENQLVSPFFTGGETTRVSYPTDSMEHKDKLMSMRGNTPHFNFATVHHELIPGHYLQGYMTRLFNGHRRAVGWTPFWNEGWALYWELILWDAGFPRNDPDRIGMLFWRLHRAARIIFSLNYQLGNWTPEQAVDFLVDEVGHERANAEAEVRRSVSATPLYQMAYLTGGLQFYSLHKELVGGGEMTAKEFHDAILQGGIMPVELVRARLKGEKLTPDFKTNWRFYTDLN